MKRFFAALVAAVLFTVTVQAGPQIRLRRQRQVLLQPKAAAAAAAAPFSIGGVTGWDVVVETANDSPSTSGILKAGPAAASYGDTIVTWQDQTANALHLTASGGIVYLENASGSYDGPDLASGTPDYFAEATGTAGNYEYNQAFFAYAVFVPDVVTGNGGLIGKNDGAGATDYRGWILYRGGTGVFLNITNLNSSKLIAVNKSAVFAADTLYVVSMYYSGSGTAAGCSIYIDGVSQSLSTSFDTLASSTILNTSNLEIGSRTGGQIPQDGTFLSAGATQQTLSGAQIAAINTEICSEFGKVC